MAFRWSERAFSFRAAVRGIGIVIASQHNAWIHSAATVAVIVAGFLTGLAPAEWGALTLAIGLVWTAEALNTAIEFLADEVSLDKRERIGQAKDAGAAGVLIASTCAAAVGLLVFVPHWMHALHSPP